jgi:hypothetical protein
MGDAELQELEDPTTWDYEGAERRPGVDAPRATIAVTFGSDDLELVERCAERLGMRMSEFIRQAAVERASRQQERAAISS